MNKASCGNFVQENRAGGGMASVNGFAGTAVGLARSNQGRRFCRRSCADSGARARFV